MNESPEMDWSTIEVNSFRELLKSRDNFFLRLLHRIYEIIYRTNKERTNNVDRSSTWKSWSDRTTGNGNFNLSSVSAPSVVGALYPSRCRNQAESSGDKIVLPYSFRSPPPNWFHEKRETSGKITIARSHPFSMVPTVAPSGKVLNDPVVRSPFRGGGGGGWGR